MVFHISYLQIEFQHAFYNNNDAMKDLKSSAKPFNKQTHRLKKFFTFLSPRVCIGSSTSNQVST